MSLTIITYIETRNAMFSAATRFFAHLHETVLRTGCETESLFMVIGINVPRLICMGEKKILVGQQLLWSVQ